MAAGSHGPGSLRSPPAFPATRIWNPGPFEPTSPRIEDKASNEEFGGSYSQVLPQNSGAGFHALNAGSLGRGTDSRNGVARLERRRLAATLRGTPPFQAPSGSGGGFTDATRRARFGACIPIAQSARSERCARTGALFTGHYAAPGLRLPEHLDAMSVCEPPMTLSSPSVGTNACAIAGSSAREKLSFIQLGEEAVFR